MKYIDSFNDPDALRPLNTQERIVVEENIGTTIPAVLKHVDLLNDWMEENTSRIDKISDLSNPIKLAFIKILEEERELLKINGVLVLYYCDLLVAYKNMGSTDDDWEYRVHVRRIYTLLHEICIDFCRKAGKPVGFLKKLNGGRSNDIYDKYDSSIKELRKFLESHDSEFEATRNKTEAHKDYDIHHQITLIENISIKESSSLINTAIKKLNGVLKTMTPLFQQFDQEMEKLTNTLGQ